MLASPRLLLADAEEYGYAVGGFNFYNLDTLFAILEAAEEELSPVILQIYSPYFSFLGTASIASAALAAIRNSSINAALHLDHANEYQIIVQALDNGFNSVMIDASHLPLKENIKITSRVVEAAHSIGVFTEAELGRIFRIGSSEDNQTNQLADPEESLIFVKETGVDSFAPAVGTAHGIYKNKPVINFERIKEIRSKINIPLVMHGGSTIPEDMIRQAIACGIRKINVGTELKYKWS